MKQDAYSVDVVTWVVVRRQGSKQACGLGFIEKNCMQSAVVVETPDQGGDQRKPG